MEKEWQPFKNLLQSGYESLLLAFHGKNGAQITMFLFSSVLYTREKVIGYYMVIGNKMVEGQTHDSFTTLPSCIVKLIHAFSPQSISAALHRLQSSQALSFDVALAAYTQSSLLCLYRHVSVAYSLHLALSLHLLKHDIQ